MEAQRRDGIARCAGSDKAVACSRACLEFSSTAASRSLCSVRSSAFRQRGERLAQVQGRGSEDSGLHHDVWHAGDAGPLDVTALLDVTLALLHCSPAAVVMRVSNIGGIARQRFEFPVDTHVWRITKALGWVPPRSTREQAYLHLNARVPAPLKCARAGLRVFLPAHGPPTATCYGERAPPCISQTRPWRSKQAPPLLPIVACRPLASAVLPQPGGGAGTPCMCCWSSTASAARAAPRSPAGRGKSPWVPAPCRARTCGRLRSLQASRARQPRSRRRAMAGLASRHEPRAGASERRPADSSAVCYW